MAGHPKHWAGRCLVFDKLCSGRTKLHKKTPPHCTKKDMWKVALCDLAGLGLLLPWNIPESPQLGLSLCWAAHIKRNVFSSILTSMLLAGK